TPWPLSCVEVPARRLPRIPWSRRKRPNRGEYDGLQIPAALPRSEDLVGRGPLGGREPGLADQGRDLLDGDRVDVVGRLVNVLLEERAPPIVGAEVECDLPRLFALGEPRGLDVEEVVEVEARAPEDPQIAVRALHLLDPLLEQRMARLERPRHERGEAAPLVLELSDRVEVVEQVVGL